MMSLPTGQEPNTATPAPGAPTTPTTAVDAASPTQDVEPKSFDAEYVKGLRSENAKTRTALRDAEAKLADIEKAKMTEAERVAARITELESANAKLLNERRDNNTRSSLVDAASRLGVKQINAALKLIERDALKVNDDGTIENADEAMRAVVKEFPGLFGPAGEPPGNPAGNRAGALTIDDIKSMSPADVAKRIDEVNAVLKNTK